MNTDRPAYGLWSLVIINAAIFIIFAFSFYKPRTAREANMRFGPYESVAAIESSNLCGLGTITASSIQTIPNVEPTLTRLAVEM